MKTQQPIIYYLCGDDPDICGGMKVIYQHVDILNQHGYRAFVLHETRPYRAKWFENQTPIVYLHDNPFFDENTIMVMPEVMSIHIKQFMPGIKKIMFCQNPYYTFKRYDLVNQPFNPYTGYEDVIGTMAISEDTMNFLNFTFQGITPHRIYNHVDSQLFCPAKKKPQICLIPKKAPRDAINLVNILRLRGISQTFDIISVDRVSEQTLARLLGESLIFLSFGQAEGFGLPAAEAMASGCMVVGYPAMGGNEFFKKEFSYPIETGDIVGFAKAVESAIRLYHEKPDIFQKRCDVARDYVREQYSKAQQEISVVAFWEELLSRTFRRSIKAVEHNRGVQGVVLHQESEIENQTAKELLEN